MRVALLLIILAETMLASQELGLIADHYAFLESAYLSGLNACDNALANALRKK